MSALSEVIGNYFLLPGRLRIAISGLRRNQALAQSLTAELSKMPGIRLVTANPLTGRALIYFDPTILSFSQIKESICSIMKDFSVAKHSSPNPSAPKAIKEPLLYTLATGGILAGLMAKRILLGRSPLASSRSLWNLAAFTSIVSGYPLLRKGIDQLAYRKRINSELIIYIATASLLAVRESMTGLAVLWIVHLTNLFHQFVKYRSQQSIRRLILKKQSLAEQIKNTPNNGVEPPSLSAGDHVTVHRGEMVPVDGEVLSGNAVVSLAPLDGSSAPRLVQKGEFILAGSKIVEGSLKVLAKQTSSNTALAQIVDFTKNAAANRGSPSANDFYPLKPMLMTVGIAAAIFLLTRDALRSLAVLLAGCPVAIGLGRDTAWGTAVAEASRRGILIKEPSVFAEAEQANTILFDKTGTLTEDCLDVTQILVVQSGLNETDLLQLAASAEQIATHPLAHTLCAAALRQGLTLKPCTGEFLPGLGVKARLDGATVLVGNELLMNQEQIPLDNISFAAARIRHSGSSAVYIAKQGKMIGVIGLRNRIRPTSRQAIADLRMLGLEHIGMISGDDSQIACTVAEELGIEHSWPVQSAQAKEGLIRKFRQQGHKVIMVGDGINDAPALAASNLGVAFGKSGSELAISSADVILTEDTPEKVVEFITLSRRTQEIVRQNTTIAAGFNIAGIALALSRAVSPLSAGFLLNFSTMAVIFNSLRLLLRRPRSVNKPIMELQRFAQPPLAPVQSSFEAPLEEAAVWHTMDVKSVCKQLRCSAVQGLTDHEVLQRRQIYGKNELAKTPRPSFWQLLSQQFKDFMVQILLGAAAVTFFLGKTKDSLLTLGIVAANAALGVIQEQKAGQSIDALQNLTAHQAKVMRAGKTSKIDSADLVPGDVIVLEAGDCVPADARLLSTTHFEVEEASLTGENLPVKKNSSLVAIASTGLGERKNMVFMGTTVTRGRATAVVISTGMTTEIGKIASSIQEHQEEQTPLQKRLDELGKYLVYGCLALSGLMFCAGLLRGMRVMDMLQTAASLAVAAIPEGLTTIVVIALAMGVQRMSKRNIIIRKLSSLETLGCATVICSDKTGTLTQNQMTVREVYTFQNNWQVTGEGYCPEGKFLASDKQVEFAAEAELTQTLLTGALCNNAKLVQKKDKEIKILPLETAASVSKSAEWIVDGDPTEGALLVAANKKGLKPNRLMHNYVRLREYPFESERRLMSVVCSQGQENPTLYCKGAPDQVLELCTHYVHNGQVKLLTEEIKSEIHQANDDMANKALRVLACAYRTIEQDDDLPDSVEEAEQDLIFCGLAGMIDPPRPEVPAAIEKCRQAGVKVVMITGDHPKTAAAIARELGLLQQEDSVVTGSVLDAMSDEDLLTRVDNVVVYARTSPHQKLRIVKALKQKGYIVAMTGDGVNDAPAIKAADIGIAMGIMGTDVTKEAASMTLADDNFATIVRAMEEGRAIYSNIRKAIRYLLATNIGEVVLMFLAVLSGLPLPLLPIQLLWINLVGDGLPAVALVNDPPAKHIMRQPLQSAKDSVFSGGLGRKVLTRGLIIGVSSLALYAWKFMRTGSIAVARTLVLAQLAISQFIHIFDCRVEKQAGYVSPLSNPLLIGAVGISMAMVVGIIHLPALQPIFNTVPLSGMDWLLATSIAAGTSFVDFAFGGAYDGSKTKNLPQKQQEIT